MRVAPAIALLLLAAAPAGAADPSDSAVDRVMADALAAWEVPGVALVVVRGDETVILKGYGRKQAGQGEPIGPDTIFPLGSCSKAFTSALVAVLADDGLLGWDDRVSDHLPTFHLSDPHADALVTVRDLLSHRTGLGGHDRLWYHAPWNLDETLRRVDKLPLSYPFRAGFEYTSLTFLAAGRLAARRAGQPWEKLVKDRLTGPLGMAGVRLTTTDLPADRAVGHRRLKDGGVEPMAYYDQPEPNPAGSVHATARDLAAWLKFHLAGGVAPGGKRLVSEAALAETRTPQTLIRMEGAARAMNPDTTQLSYAMGWVVSDHRGKKVCAHGGLIDGFRAQVTLLPDEKLGIALLNNLHETRMNQAVTNTLVDLYCDLPERDWNAFFKKYVADTEAAKRAALAARDAARKPDTKPSLAADGYAGEYTDPAYGPAKVWTKGGKLTLDWGSLRCPLEHFQDDVFRITGGGAELEEGLVEFAVAPGRGAVALRFGGVVFRR